MFHTVENRAGGRMDVQMKKRFPFFTSSKMRSERDPDGNKHFMNRFFLEVFVSCSSIARCSSRLGRFLVREKALEVQNRFMCRKHVKFADQWRRLKKFLWSLFHVFEAFSVPNVFIILIFVCFCFWFSCCCFFSFHREPSMSCLKHFNLSMFVINFCSIWSLQGYFPINLRSLSVYLTHFQFLIMSSANYHHHTRTHTVNIIKILEQNIYSPKKEPQEHSQDTNFCSN